MKEEKKKGYIHWIGHRKDVSDLEKCMGYFLIPGGKIFWGLLTSVPLNFAVNTVVIQYRVYYEI